MEEKFGGKQCMERKVPITNKKNFTRGGGQLHVKRERRLRTKEDRGELQRVPNGGTSNGTRGKGSLS